LAETFKAKTNTYFLFQSNYIPRGLSFVKIVPISNISIIKKGAHLNFAMGTIFHRYETGFLESLAQHKCFSMIHAMS